MLIRTPSKKSRKSDAISQLLHAKIFIKPSQGVAGIRVKGRPAWSSDAENILKVIWSDFAAKGIANFCLGQKGKQFYKCLQEKSAILDYSQKSGLWFAVDTLIAQGKELEAKNWVRYRFTKAPYPDSATQNGHRIARYIAIGGKSLEDAVKDGLYVNKNLHPTSIPKNAKHKDKLEAIRREVLESFINEAASAAHLFAQGMVNNIFVPPEVAAAFEKVVNIPLEDLKAVIEAELRREGFLTG